MTDYTNISYDEARALLASGVVFEWANYGTGWVNGTRRITRALHSRLHNEHYIRKGAAWSPEQESHERYGEEARRDANGMARMRYWRRRFESNDEAFDDVFRELWSLAAASGSIGDPLTPTECDVIP